MANQVAKLKRITLQLPFQNEQRKHWLVCGKNEAEKSAFINVLKEKFPHNVYEWPYRHELTEYTDEKITVFNNFTVTANMSYDKYKRRF